MSIREFLKIRKGKAKWNKVLEKYSISISYETGKKKTKAGFKASIYELTARAYLAILLNSINIEDMLTRVDEATASSILGDIMRVST